MIDWKALEQGALQMLEVAKQFREMIDFPALILLFMLASGLWVVRQAQKRKDFDFADMLKDETGKPSALRLGIFVCMFITSWVMMYLTIDKTMAPMYFVWYLLIWSGAKVAEKAILVWGAMNGVKFDGTIYQANENSNPAPAAAPVITDSKVEITQVVTAAPAPAPSSAPVEQADETATGIVNGAALVLQKAVKTLNPKKKK